jgi:hypothetical protein
LHVVDFKNVAQFPVNKINCFTQTWNSNPIILLFFKRKSEAIDQSKVRTRSLSLSSKKLNIHNLPMIIDDNVIKNKLQRLNMNLNDYKHLFWFKKLLKLKLYLKVP